MCNTIYIKRNMVQFRKRSVYNYRHQFGKDVKAWDLCRTSFGEIRQRDPPIRGFLVFPLCQVSDQDCQRPGEDGKNVLPSSCLMSLIIWNLKGSFTGECDQPDQKVRSCQEPGNQFLIANQKFTINYTKCEGIKESLEGVSEIFLPGRLVYW
ncbi:hypothetical protein Avbf_12718 [Armadillidium vulgare]|nr:hypothetical protein Avbf_12718 [Armadillidium vulgare]